VLLFGPTAGAQGEKPVVRGYLFHSETCPDCRQVMSQVMPALYRQFGQQLQIMAIDISEDEANYQWLLDAEKAYGVSEDEAAIPVLFIGEEYLIGPEQITGKAVPLVEAHLDAGVDYPEVPPPEGAPEPTVRFMFFYSPTCAFCRDVEDQVLPKIVEKYGDRVQWEAYDRSDPANYRALLILGRDARLPQDRQGAVPLVFVGDEHTMYSLLIGGIEIPAYLENAIDWYMGVGGVDLPSWTDELFKIAATPFPQPSPRATTTPTTTREATSDPEATRAPDGSAIHMAYFAETGCSECSRVSAALDQLKKRFPNLVVHEYNILDDLELNLCLSEELDVPEKQRHDAPAVFVGSDYLVDNDITYQALIEMVSRYEGVGAEPRWENCGEAEPPPLPTLGMVIGSALVDGLNPCAFATIIFLVSYLTVLERKGYEIVLVGLAFTLGVFLSYLAFGMLLREAFAGLTALVGPVLRPALNIVLALSCGVLAVLSFDDYRKARKGKAKDMTLRLPDRLRGWVNATIRRSSNVRGFVAAAFFAGVVVSFIELACTGWVYVPIIHNLSDPAYRAQSTLALILYCVVFIIPLVVVFVAVFLGTSSRQLGLLLQRNLALVKLVTALVFVGIGIWLLFDVVRVWGVLQPLLAFASG
jgi:cytochrome c biogenesis protein CcdA/thiol-disulfide isomerase/thioredoxin